MQLKLHEQLKMPYARNLFQFPDGIYFNTYIRKNPKPGDTIYELDLGIFKIEQGSTEIKKVVEVEVENYTVIDGIIYYYIKGKTFEYNPATKKTTLKPELGSANYNYLTRESVFYYFDENWKLNPKDVLVHHPDTGFQRFKQHGWFNQNHVLAGEIMNIDDFSCYAADGQKKWSVKVSDALGIPAERLVWRKNHIERIYPTSDFWILYYSDNTVVQLNPDKGVGWFETDSPYHTYTYEGDTLYALSNHVISKIDAKTGEELLIKDITAIKEKYSVNLYQGGAWIYDDYLFFPVPLQPNITSTGWLVFNKHNLEEVGLMNIANLAEGEVVLIPGQFCGNFIFSKGKVYINDTADWLRVFDIEFCEE